MPMIVLSSPPWGVLSAILSRYNVDEKDAECRKDVALTEDEIAELGSNAIEAAAGRPLMLILHLTVALAAQYNNVLQATYDMKEVPMVFVREGGYVKQQFFDKKRGLQPAYKELTSSTDLFFIWVPKDEEEIAKPRRSIPWQFPIARALIGTYYATYVCLLSIIIVHGRCRIGWCLEIEFEWKWKSCFQGKCAMYKPEITHELGKYLIF